LFAGEVVEAFISTLRTSVLETPHPFDDRNQLTPAALGKQPAAHFPRARSVRNAGEPRTTIRGFFVISPGARVSAFSSLGHFSAGELAGDGAACILIIVTQIICGLAR